jgi:ligand-binding sensor protein/GAF domain-containing protein
MGNVRKNRFRFVGRHAGLKVTDLIDKVTLQAIQDQFTDEYHVANGLLNANADPITFERGHCNYCKAVRETESGCELCRRSDKVLINAIRKHKKAFWHICESGLLDFGAPILVEGKIVAFLLWGQIRYKYCNRRNNGISVPLKHLRFGKATDGKNNAVSATLEREYLCLKSRKEKEILMIAKAGFDFANKLSGILNTLVGWETPRVTEFVAQMMRKQDLNALFNFCVSEIPKLLETDNCSIFTVVRQKAKAKPRLVLQKTSYRINKCQEGRASYAKGKGLTGWVWKNQCALRLDDVTNERERARYPGLEWSHTVDDSNVHKEWLGVPLLGRSGDVIGVIRVPAKKKKRNRPGGGFDLRDEIRLMEVGQHVAHEIELLSTREKTSTALRICQDCAVSLCSASKSSSIERIVVDSLEKIFGKTGKAYFFNIFDRDSEKLMIQDVGGSLTKPSMRQEELTKDSLSGRCIEERRPIIIHNLPEAKQKKIYFDLAKSLECAMSVPICFGDELFGALSVGSDRKYEFTEEPDLLILNDIASIAAAGLARLETKEMEQLSRRVRGITHNLSNRISTLKNGLSLLRCKVGKKFQEEINRIDEGIDFMYGAVEAAKQYDRLGESIPMISFELGVILQRLERLYLDKPIRWRIRGRLSMVGEQSLIEQTIVELLDNALRFIHKKRGRVQVSAYRRKNAVIIQIDDNGPGIVKGRKMDIFNPSETTDPAGHFGFGLSFVRSVVQRHGGHVTECGTMGKGASFRMVFPQ